MRQFKALLVTLMVALLVACAGPISGTIVDKEYKPAYTYTEMVPMYTTSCDAKGFCRTNISYYYPQQRYVPERWRVQVRNEEGRERWVSVSESRYNTLDNGEWYSTEEDK